ncbi:MAG: VWA domain-containing protein [Dehalococcoidia bacterium]
MARKTTTILTAMALLLLAAPLPAAAQEPLLRARIVSVSDVHYPDVRLVVDVTDASLGQPVQLTLDNFEATLNGQPAPVISAEIASSEDAPLDLLVIVDTSGSMAGEPMSAAKDAVKALVAELGANDRVAIMSFADEVATVQDYTVDRALITAAIDGLVARGNTALYLATASGAFKSATSTAERRAVVLLSDGADYGGVSTVSRDDALGSAAGAGVPFYTVAYGTDLDSEYLTQIARESQGRFLEAPSPDDIQGLYAGIGRLLRSQYVVTIDGSSVRGLASVPVQVRVSAGDLIADATAAYEPSPRTLPSIVVEGLEPGDALDAPRRILALVTGDEPVTRVVFEVDGVNVGEATTAPYEFTYEPSAFGGGQHTLSVRVESALEPVTRQITFASKPPAAAGGGLPLLPIAFGLLLLVAGGGALLYNRARNRPGKGVPASQRITPWAAQVARRNPVAVEDAVEPTPEPENVGEPMGVLISRGGPGIGAEYIVGSSPVSIGSGTRCGVRINDPELAHEEARVWVRGGHLMLHTITRLTAIAYDGTSGGWEILEPGDSFDVGRHQFEFRLLPSDQPVTESPVDASDLLGDQASRPGLQPSSPQPRPLRFAELMPKNDIEAPDQGRQAG